MSVRGLRLHLGALAAGGLMLGHWVVFLLREPDAGARALLLKATGHALLPQFAALAALAAAAALVALPGRAAAARERPPAYGAVLRRLAALQCGGFVALESAERLAAHGHAHAHGILTDPVLLPGVAVQAVVAVAAAALVSGLVRLAVAAPAGRALVGTPFLSRVRLPTVPALRPQRPGQAAPAVRGPPSSSR